jgi:enamine deaminase RidA (YjgF/YER057c/UK114 family)
MLRHLVPKSIRTPFARYSHAVEVPPDARWLVCSGQLGISPDDTIPRTTEEQAVLCFEAIGACLAEAGMSFGDIVRINAYVTAREHMAPYMTVRDRYVALPPPASTLMIVSGFTRPEFNVEIEVIAAKAIGV